MSEHDTPGNLAPGEAWPAGPLTSPVCPHCGQKEQPRVVEEKGTEHIVYECGSCDRQWTVRLQNPEQTGTVSTRRH